MKQLFFILLLFYSFINFAQLKDKNILTLQEYLGYVKEFHPIAKQARLATSSAEAKLLKARGAFDPKIQVDFAKKEFKNTEYYNNLNASFKVPTWYGVEFKADYENNSGVFLNPQNNTSDEDLYGVGVNLSLAKGLLINDRMATLKKAKLYTKQAKAEQQLLVNKVLFNSILTYFKWLKNYKTKLTYDTYLTNAQSRFENVKTNFELGDKSAIDTLEAKINLKNRKLDLEKSKIAYIKSRLELSNYLWLENDIPLELKESVIPDNNTLNFSESILNISNLNINENTINDNPKIQSLYFKKERFKIDKKLKTNNLLPKIDFQYNFLTSERRLNSINTSNFKTGLNISIPLFLRKERGDLRLSKLKLKDIDFDLASNKITLQNKIRGTFQEIASYKKQQNILKELVNDYNDLVLGETRKFNLGESSLFLVNYREVKWIETQLKLIETEYILLSKQATLFNIVNNTI